MSDHDIYVECEYCDDDEGPKLGIVDVYGNAVCYPCAEEWDMWTAEALEEESAREMADTSSAAVSV